MEAEKSKVKVLANSVLVRVSSGFVDSWLLAVSSHGLSCVCRERDREGERQHALMTLLIRTLTLADKGPTLYDLILS